MSNLKLESDFDRGYLSGLQETLELWRRNWKEETASAVEDGNTEDYEVKLQILKMIASYKKKLAELKNDQDFMADRKRCDKLTYYEKVLAHKEWRDAGDFIELQKFDFALGAWKKNWASEAANKMVDTAASVLGTSQNANLANLIESFKAKLESLSADTDFMADKARADRLSYYQKILDSRQWQSDDDMIELKKHDVTLELW